MKVPKPGQVSRWSDEKLIEQWNELRAACTRAGWVEESQLPMTYFATYLVLRFEVLARFHQQTLF